ncbi:hypothetical protein CCP1ISM_2080003 [Azospirillaceae bacterium]
MNVGVSAEERKKLQDSLLKSAEGLVRQMRRDAESGELNQLEQDAGKLQEVTKSKDFPTQRSREFLDCSKSIQRDAYEKCTAALLTQLGRKIRSGDEEGKNSMLSQARDYLSRAMRLGADDEFRHSFDRALEVITLTSCEGIDKRAKAEAARRTELKSGPAPKSPGGIERRRAVGISTRC